MTLASLLKNSLVLTFGATSLALLCSAAQAQSADGGEAAVEVVTVTGSRIANAGYAAPTPVTALTAGQLLATTPSTITDALIRLPQLSGSANRSYCCAAGTAGNYLDLRQMGANRTLVLLNGNRVTPSTASGLVDANVLPEILIDRVEIVTGGASAAYGSDAVAGVVNYITDLEFEGLKVDVQGGISNYSDDKQFKVGVAGGTSVLGGRGHLTASVEHFQADGIDTMLSRPLSAKSWVLGGSGTAASPYVPYANSVFFTGTTGGLVIASPAIPVPLVIPGLSSPFTGIEFLPGGTPVQWNPGEPVPGNIVARIGGDGYSPGPGMQPLGQLRTDHVFGRFGYDFSQSLKGYVQVNAARVISQNAYGFPPASSNWGTLATIYSGNPFLPASLQTQMTDQNIPSFSLSRSNTDFGGPSYNHSSNDYYEVSGGLKGELGGDWTWSAYLGYGHTRLDSQERRAVNVGRFLAAVDAVEDPATGNTVCRVTLTSPGSIYDGCVPINLFGVGSPSADAVAYVTGTNRSVTDSAQTVMSLDFQGSLLSLPAGDVSIATGVDWRTRDLSGTSNPVAASRIDPATIRGVSTTLCPVPGDPGTCRLGGWIQGNVAPQASVSDTVKEGYLETIVPLLKDQYLAESLDFNGAVRYTNYSNSGGVFTWKLGLNYQPVSDIRLRATRSRDIRAPNLFELFASPVTAFQAFITNPFTGNQIPTIATITSGNPGLKPEIADTYTVGAVLTPSFIEGLQASIDYYNIRLTDAITATSAQSILTDCFSGDASRCALITGNPATDAITVINVLKVNSGVEHRSGIDFDLTYAAPIDQWGMDGGLTFRFLANYVATADQVSGGVVTQYAGTANPLRSVLTLAGVPRWRGMLSATYVNGPYSFTVAERYIGSMKQLGAIPDAVFASPRVPAIFYTSISAAYTIDTNTGPVELYGTINNLFNQQPPLVPNTLPGVGYPTVPNLYDLDGRYFTLGLRFQM